MAVAYWQFFVIGSVAFSYTFLGRKAAFWVAVGWTIWTLFALFYAPLILIQLASSWGTYLGCRKLSSLASSVKKERSLRVEQERELAALRKQIDELASSNEITARQKEVLTSLSATTPQALSIVSGGQHYEILKDALIEANETVSILSGWIGSPLLDSQVQEAFSDALERGVNIRIGFGWESSTGHDMNPVGQQAEQYLVELERKRDAGRLAFAKFPNHEKVLVCDDSWVLIGSNNWLSNKAFRNSERSVRISSKQIAAEERDRIRDLVAKNRKAAVGLR